MSGHIVVQNKYLCTEWKLIKIIQIFKIQNRLSIRKPVPRKNPHYPVPILVLNVLVYTFGVKKRCEEKSWNKLSLAADLLNACSRYLQVSKGSDKNNQEKMETPFSPNIF